MRIALLLSLTGTSLYATAALTCDGDEPIVEGWSPADAASAVPTNAMLFLSNERFVFVELVDGDEHHRVSDPHGDDDPQLEHAALPELAPNHDYQLVVDVGGARRTTSFRTGQGPDHDEPALTDVEHDVQVEQHPSAGCGSMPSPFGYAEQIVTVTAHSDDAVVVELLRVQPDHSYPVSAGFFADGVAQLEHRWRNTGGTLQVRVLDAAGNETYGDEIEVAPAGGCAQARGSSATIALLLAMIVRARTRR